MQKSLFDSCTNRSLSFNTCKVLEDLVESFLEAAFVPFENKNLEEDEFNEKNCLDHMADHFPSERGSNLDTDEAIKLIDFVCENYGPEHFNTAGVLDSETLFQSVQAWTKIALEVYAESLAIEVLIEIFGIIDSESYDTETKVNGICYQFKELVDAEETFCCKDLGSGLYLSIAATSGSTLEIGLV